MFDLHQQQAIDDNRRDRYAQRWEVLEEIAAAKEEASLLREEAKRLDNDHLEQAVAELALAVKAIQRILVESGVVSPERLAQMVDIVDLEDGTADGMLRS
jgi:hypothetical protein